MTAPAKTTPKPAAKLERKGTGEEARYYRARANGTTRHVPLLAGDALKLAQDIRERRTGEHPETMRQIAASLHRSVSSVRRLLNSLALTEQHTANQEKAAKLRAARAAKKSAQQ